MTDRAEKIKFLEALAERERRRKSAPLIYFEPHARQREFIEQLKAKRGGLFAGGNRSGKTTANAAITVCHLYGYWVFDVPDLELTSDGDYPPRDRIDSQYWIRRPDGVPISDSPEGQFVTGLALPRGVGQIFWPAVQALLPPAIFTPRKLHVQRAGNPSTVVRVRHKELGWVLNLGSVEAGSMQFEGTSPDFACFDEPPSRPVFEAVWRGLTDKFSPWWVSFTPLGPYAQWLHYEYFREPRDDVAIVEVSIDENPHLLPEAREAFFSSLNLTDEQLLARRSGKFGFLTHRAFPSYDPDIHRIASFPIPRSWPKLLVCDPASRRPFYLVWLAFDPKLKDWHAYREFPFERLHHEYRNSPWAMRDYATIIRNMEGGERIHARVLDPRFGKAKYTFKGETFSSVQEDFAGFGLMFDTRVPETKSEEAGIQRIRDLLWYDTKHALGSFNKPHLFVHDCCRTLDYALTNYSFVPPAARDDMELPEKLKDAYKDSVDALRYGILYGIPPTQESSNYIPQRDFEQENEISSDWY